MTYPYRAYTDTGKEVSGTVHAGSEKAAIQKIEELGLLPLAIAASSEHQKPWYLRDLQMLSGTLSDAEQANLSRHLATLIQAGLPSTDVLEIAKLSQPKKKLGTALETAQRGLMEGRSVSEAFDFPGNPFSPEFHSFLHIGDVSNSLGQTLGEAAKYFAVKATTKDKIASALIYPAILMLAGLGLILVLTFVLVPTLQPLFQSADVTPPLMFRVIDGFGNVVTQYWVPALAVLIALPIAIKVWSATETGQRRWQSFVYRIPKIGPMVFQSQLEQVCRGISMLVKSGFTLPTTFEQIAKTTTSQSLAATFGAVSEDLTNGETASTGFANKPFLPKDFNAIVDLAERTNRWPEVLLGYADALSQRNEQTRNRLLTLITPAITIVVGLLAGGMIYAVMSALLEINAIATP